MALSSFTFVGSANIAVNGTPQAVQVTGPTIVVTNIGGATVYGSLGGSASTTLNAQPNSYISGQAVGFAGGGNTVGTAGFAVPPGAQSPPIAVGANSWLWLATAGQPGAVNVANGT